MGILEVSEPGHKQSLPAIGFREFEPVACTHRVPVELGSLNFFGEGPEELDRKSVV